MSPKPPRLGWRQLYFRRPITPEQIVTVLRLWAHDPAKPYVVLECRVAKGEVTYLLATTEPALESVTAIVTSTMPGTHAGPLALERAEMSSAVVLKVRGSERPLRHEAIQATIAAALAAAATESGTVVQVILGDRRSAALQPASTASDAATRRLLRDKTAEPGFGCTIRLGSTSTSSASLMSLFQALSTLESAGVRLKATSGSPKKLHTVSLPWQWSQYLNIEELAALTLWPIGEGDLAGVRSPHPVVLPPAKAARPLLVVGDSTAPGHASTAIGMDVQASTRHLWLVGPPGVGKSELLAQLALDTDALGYGQAVVEPKGDLCRAIMTRLKSTEQVVILDPTDSAPLGLNPLAGGDPDVRAEALLGIFSRLYGDAIGPRSRDVLHHALLTMTRYQGLSLPMLPLLLTSPGFRQSVVARVVQEDPLSLGAFWGWYQNLSEAERSSVITPVLNKVRLLTTNRYLRAVLGQRQPKLSIQQVMEEGKMLLVPLQAGVIGQDAARILGSLVVSELFTATATRARQPVSARRPFFITVDEFQQYVDGADFAEAMALFRGYKVGLRAAHQHLGQLPRELREAMLQTARSRVVFQTGHRDAAELAKGHPELGPEDISALPAFEVYASLVNGNTASPYVSARTRKLGAPVRSASSVLDATRARYGQDRAVTEQELLDAVPSTTNAAQRSSGRVRRQP